MRAGGPGDRRAGGGAGHGRSSTAVEQALMPCCVQPAGAIPRCASPELIEWPLNDPVHCNRGNSLSTKCARNEVQPVVQTARPTCSCMRAAPHALHKDLALRIGQRLALQDDIRSQDRVAHGVRAHNHLAINTNDHLLKCEHNVLGCGFTLMLIEPGHENMPYRAILANQASDTRCYA